jgi:putative heme-binding domain-containing protein
LRAVALHGDKTLDAVVKKHWGTIHGGTPEERLAEMRRISNDLRAGSGRPAAGRALFLKHCGTCHRLFGEGQAIGPELTHANRKNTAELLAAIVDPSAIVRREYANYLVHTTDGRVLSGLIAEQSPGSVTLVGAKNERTSVPRGEIESLAESAASLMPDDLLKPLLPAELRDLFSYLQSEAPPGEASGKASGP